MEDIEVKPPDSKGKSYVFSWLSLLWEPLAKYTPKLAEPLEIYRRGHVLLAAYVIGSVALLFYLVNSLLLYAYQAIDNAEGRLHLSQRSISVSKQGLYVICCVLFVPIVLALIVFPVRIIWMRGKIIILELTKGALFSFQLSLRSTFIALRVSLPHLAPLIAFTFVFFTFRDKILENTVYQVGLGLAFFLGLVSLYKALPILVVPVISVAGQYKPEVAMQLCLQIVGPRKSSIALIILLGGVLSAGLHYLFNSVISPLAFSVTLELSIIFMLLWYLTIALSLIVIEGIVEFQNANQARAQTTESAATANVPQGPVYISVENLWVKK